MTLEGNPKYIDANLALFKNNSVFIMNNTFDFLDVVSEIYVRR